MPDNSKQPDKPDGKGQRAPKVSLSPLTVEEVTKALLEPPPEKERSKANCDEYLQNDYRRNGSRTRSPLIAHVWTSVCVRRRRNSE
jgi:hypothetical protein